jgi:hypothetical protein
MEEEPRLLPMTFLPLSPWRRAALPAALAATALAATALAPTVPLTSQAAAPAMAAAAMLKGTFRPAEKPVQGGFVIERRNGTQVLRLTQDFRTSPDAPDLKLAFSPSAMPLAGSKPPAYPLKPGTYTVLAPLKAPSGAQTYVLPASLDLAAQKSVLIWCEQFNATMAWAPLR